ncbi:hypothetical protein SCHPADRAFT_641329 [Schizopora paradoxa]|uniref:Uncharacterized protein n=1 Tax=Schizopora paradoxa TaxID=27342 RepID=A0A0H2R8A4_9AGAM|nr:hypothetical protein SCHPADRAFT_641329 [Schizopora paradoxa]
MPHSHLRAFRSSTYSPPSSPPPSSNDDASTSTHLRRTPLADITAIVIPHRQLPPSSPPAPSKSPSFPNEGTTTLPPGSTHACTFAGAENLHA